MGKETKQSEEFKSTSQEFKDAVSVSENLLAPKIKQASENDDGFSSLVLISQRVNNEGGSEGSTITQSTVVGYPKDLRDSIVSLMKERPDIAEVFLDAAIYHFMSIEYKNESVWELLKRVM
jgi:hypothetical protein